MRATVDDGTLIDRVAPAPDGSAVAIYGPVLGADGVFARDGVVSIRDGESLAVRRRFTIPGNDNDTDFPIAWLRLDRLVVVESLYADDQEDVYPTGARLRVLDPQTGAVVRVVDLPSAIRGLAVSGERLLVTSSDRDGGHPRLRAYDADGNASRAIRLAGLRPRRNEGLAVQADGPGRARVLRSSTPRFASVDLARGTVRIGRLRPVRGRNAFYRFLGSGAIEADSDANPGVLQFPARGRVRIDRVLRGAGRASGFDGELTFVRQRGRLAAYVAGGHRRWSIPAPGRGGRVRQIGSVVYTSTRPRRGGQLTARSARTGRPLATSGRRIVLLKPGLSEPLGDLFLSTFRSAEIH